MEFRSGFNEGSAPQSYEGAIPALPAATAPAVALPAAAPALGLGLATVTIIVTGNANTGVLKHGLVHQG